MATTTNFGWETPDDTDLVKDGALAIRTLGSAIDTSLVDLKGGTTGQVLSKTSNTDMDFTWVAQDDSNAIQNSIVDAKADLITATAADTPARLAVGSNGTKLVADSAQTTGLKWEGFVGCATYLNTTAAITPSTATFLSMTEEIDTNGFHSDSTNPERITIPSGYAGKYLVTWNTNWVSSSANKEAGIFKNTSGFQVSLLDSGRQSFGGSYILDLAVGDYLRVYCYNYDTVNVNVLGSSSGNPRCSFFSVQYLGA